MKKRNLIFGLVCLSALILGACSKGGQTTSSSQQGEESPTTSQSTSEPTSSSEPVHVHNFVFDKFIWTETPGAYTAAAQYKCTADNYTEIHDATVTKVDAESVVPTCEEGGKNVWLAQYDGHEEKKTETLPSLGGHDFQFSSFIWTMTPGAYTAVARYVCSRDTAYEDHAATVTKVDAQSVLPTCEEGGKNVWQAEYDGHQETKEEILDSFGGHEWGEPQWTWYGLNTEARATFTCLRNDEHTHVETATVENGGIVEFENIEPTCIQDGHITYRATVEFNGQTYFDDRVDNIPAYEHSDIDGYGFCELCGEYQGTEIEKPDVQMNFDYLDAGNYFYRFAINSESLYKKVLHNIPSAECLFFGMRNEAWESISISVSDYVAIEETDDNYLYIVLNLTAPVANAYFRFDMDCAHNYIDAHGFCTVCGEYCGLSIEEANWNTSVVLPEVDGDETLFLRFAIDDEHHYTLVIPGNNWIQACWSEKYYLKSGDVLTEVLNTEFYGVYGTSIASRTDPKYFFNLGGRPNDGYLYAVYEVDSQESIGGGDAIIVSTEHNPSNSMPGFCVGGDYLGTTINIGYTVNTGHMAKNQSNYYRFADPGDYKIKSICNSPLQDSYFTFYRMTESHELEEITIDDTFRNLEETADGYYYIKLTAGAALDDGPFQIKAEVVTFTVAFYAKFVTEENIAALTEGLTDYFNPKLVNLQFVTLGDSSTNVGPFATLVTTYNDENENDIDVLIGANGDTSNKDLKNAGYQKLNETSYSYGTDAKRKLWCKIGNTSDQRVLEVQAYLAANWANQA